MKLILPVVILLLIPFCISGNPVAKPDSFWVAGVENPRVSLNGTWKFTMKPPENYWENNVDFQQWADIQVPGECQMQGFPIKHDHPYVYKIRFLVPEDYAGKQVKLSFYGVYSYAKVWVNGHFVREHFGGFTKWDCDISKFVTPGKKGTLTVEIVDRTDDISYGSGYAKHQIGGILRDVGLVALPKQHFKTLYYETDLDKNYVNASLNVFYELSQNIPTEIKVDLFNSENKLVESRQKEVQQLEGVFEIPVKNPQKWDAEHPNLYLVVVTLFTQGKKALQRTEKIGFREVVVDGNKLLVNGMPVKLRGACRHDINPLSGRMTTPEYDEKDVLLAKEANMNFIRTSHYPPSETFLKYCDKYGIYVENETAVCFVGTHRTEAYQPGGATQNDPDFTGRYLSQLEEQIQNHRNHPCVIIWSIGNENTFGLNFVKSYSWAKNHDSTRPVIYSYPGQVPDSTKIYDIISMHYPNWRGICTDTRISTSGFESKTAPMLFDEWAHVACYTNFELKDDPNIRNFWGQSLDSMWTNSFDADGCLGGAIWCMIDETFMLLENLPGFNKWWGIIDPNVIPATYAGPCVGYGEWGILDTWRRKKPEFWETKKAYSPTKIYVKQINQFTPGVPLQIAIHNRFDHTNFNALKIDWKYGNNSGTLANVNLAPHQKGIIEIPAQNWNSGEKLHLSFFQNDTFLVDEYNLRLGKRKVYIPTCKPGRLEVIGKEDEILVSGKKFNLKVNTKTGLLENIRLKNEELIQSGPYINLKLPGKHVQYSTIKMEDYAEYWKCTGFNFDLNNGIAEIHTEGKYDSISAKFTIQFDANGIFNINYQIENAPKNKTVQEVGLKFITGNFKQLVWDRNSYFTAYPETHIGRPLGEVDLSFKPKMKYRENPQHPWEWDSKDFFYFGLDTVLPYTNIIRSMKENIFSYALKTDDAKLEVFSDGAQACRFDKIDGRNTLLIDSLWDYNGLLWGNYMKLIKSKSEYSGNVVFSVD